MNPKYIKILALIPVELIEAENVVSVVIIGETYSKALVIRKAKEEAEYLKEKENFLFCPYSLKQLENIINYY